MPREAPLALLGEMISDQRRDVENGSGATPHLYI